MHDLPPSLFDGNNFNTSPPVVACAVSHALAWRSQRQGRGLLVLEDDVNMVLNVRDRIDKVRRSAREVGAELVMMAPGETFEEDTVTCSADGDDCSDGDDEGVRLLRQKMTLYAQVQRLSSAHPALCWFMTSHTPRLHVVCACVTAPQAYFLEAGAGQKLLRLLRGGVTCAIDWWLGLMWHGGHIDAAVRRVTCALYMACCCSWACCVAISLWRV